MTDEKTMCIPPVNDEAEHQTWTACLMVIQGADIGNRILLNKEEITIGRAKNVDVRLTQGHVSRKHAVIQCVDAQQFLLIDQNSTNGTSVNAKEIQSTLLKDQDIISIGTSKLKFIASDNPEQAYYEELYRQSQMDRALQIYNKHYFLSKLDEEIIRCQRYDNGLSLALFDVDHFKRLNDIYGHLAGDAALVQLAEICKQRTRVTDILCRYGGEEFAIIMPHTNQKQAFIFAESIRLLVARTPVYYADTTIEMTISIGITSYSSLDTPPCTKELLIAEADKALYQAKHNGRNKTIIFNPSRHL